MKNLDDKAQAVSTHEGSCVSVNSDIPNIFWKYYDLFRRNQISIRKYSELTGIRTQTIVKYLHCL